MKEIIIIVATALIAGGGFGLGHMIGEDSAQEEINFHKQRGDSLEVEVAKSFILLNATVDEIHEHSEQGADHAAEAYDILNVAIDSLSIERLLEVKNDPDAISRIIHGDTL